MILPSFNKLVEIISKNAPAEATAEKDIDNLKLFLNLLISVVYYNYHKQFSNMSGYPITMFRVDILLMRFAGCKFFDLDFETITHLEPHEYNEIRRCVEFDFNRAVKVVASFDCPQRKTYHLTPEMIGADNQETQDQIAEVLLTTGTPEQQLEAAIASGVIKKV